MYTNRFTRANPGLLIYLVDQSGSMTDEWSDGLSLAEQTALVINRCIEETICRFFDINYEVKEVVNVVIIGYGGIKNSDSAYVITKGTIKELANSPKEVKKVKRKISDGRGGFLEVDVEMPIWIEPTAVWGTPMASAFELAYNIVDGWVTKKQNREVSKDANVGHPSLDPVPIIINVTDGMPTDDIERVKEWANKIKAISCPDGNPLIFNVHLSPGSGAEVMFPKQRPNGDVYTELMYELSSELPEVLAWNGKHYGFDVEGNEKTFISNCKSVEKLIQIFAFGTFCLC